MLFRLLDEILFTWGLPLLLLSASVLYFFALRAFPYLHPRRTLRIGFGGNARSALRALSLALGGTLGVGNITGVALALAAGGAGALFWMWVSAALAMFLKYGEIVLAMLTRRRDREGNYEGGAMFYLCGVGRLGKAASFLFAGLCLLCALTLGAPVQSNTAAGAGWEALGIHPLLTGMLFLFLTAIAVFGGVGKIAAFTEKIIPFMSVLYLFLCLYAVAAHIDGLPAALGRVFSDAFCLSSGASGAGGFLASRAIRYGVTRGLLSNEAGAGTAPMAHAVAENTPASQGVMGILEVAIDTFVFCTATALPLLIAYPTGFPDCSGIALVTGAFSSLVGRFSVPLLSVSLFLFAYATVLAWCHYGRCALKYLVRRKWAERAYLYLYIFLVGSGAYIGEGILWSLTDGVMSLLTMLHAVALVPLLPLVVRESRRAGVLGEVAHVGNGKGKRAKRGGKILGKGCKKGAVLSTCGMSKAQTGGMKQGTGKAVTLVSVEKITAQRMTDL